MLASCYRRSIQVADANGIRTIAFPSISTGIYGYPIDLAASVATASVREAIEDLEIQSVTFCCFSESDLRVYEAALARPLGN